MAQANLELTIHPGGWDHRVILAIFFHLPLGKLRSHYYTQLGIQFLTAHDYA